MLQEIPEPTDIARIAGKDITYAQLRSNFNLPEMAIVKGCNAMVIDDGQAMQRLQFYHFMACFPIRGFSGKSFKRLMQVDTLLQSPIGFFDPVIVNAKVLNEVGFGPRQTELLLHGILKWRTKGFELFRIIRSLGINNCGNRIAKEWSKKLAGIGYNFDSMAGKVLEELENSDHRINNMQMRLRNMGYTIHLPVEDTAPAANTVKFLMTGSPKSFGYKTKALFKSELVTWLEVDKLKDAQVLITDNLQSTSSKMKQAKSLGIETITYGMAVLKAKA